MLDRIPLLAVFVAGTMIPFSTDAERAWAQLSAQSRDIKACPSPISVEVAGRREPVTIRTDFRLDELAAQAAHAGKPPAYKPLGFYLGRVAYKINWHKERSAVESCPPVTRILASVALIDRQIEIG